MLSNCYPDTTDWGCSLSPEEVAELDPDIKERCEMLAWNTLARMTGYRLSLCPVVIRPCAARCHPGVWREAPVNTFGTSFSPYMLNGTWYNSCGCSRPGDCSCSSISEIVLPVQEVSGPIVVKQNGATLDPSAYRVDNGNRLVRQDGEAWPLCQDMGVPLTDTEHTTLSVSYYPGVGPDKALSYAAGLLAIEWYKACMGEPCALPEGTTQVVRQGVVISIPERIGLSGIRTVDEIVGMYNPHMLKTPSRVVSPDTMRGRIRTAVGQAVQGPGQPI